jgi:hypothetical protein
MWLLSTRSFAQGWSVGVIVAAGEAVRLAARRRRVAPVGAPTA